MPTMRSPTVILNMRRKTNRLPLVIATLALLAGGSALPHCAAGADRVVALDQPKPVRKDLQALPRMAHPVDEAERRINAALARLDVRVRKSSAACRNNDGKPGDWERSVDVPMAGPGFVSFAVSDSTFCGDAHPGFGNTAIVYDLRTGDPADWTALLPPALTGKVEVFPQTDGARMITLSSKRLYALYLAGYDRARGARP